MNIPRTHKFAKFTKFTKPNKKRSKINTTNEAFYKIKRIKHGILNIRSKLSKGAIINDLISDDNIELICLTDTWLCQDDYVNLMNFQFSISAL